MTPEQILIDEVKNSLNKITPFPWSCSLAKWPNFNEQLEGYTGAYYLIDAKPEMMLSKANADFIGKAPEYVSSLLAIIERYNEAKAKEQAETPSEAALRARNLWNYEGGSLADILEIIEQQRAQAVNEAKAREATVRQHAKDSIKQNKALLDLLADEPATVKENLTVHPDQATFTLTVEEYDKLTELLDAPARELPELKRLFQRKTVLDDASGADSEAQNPIAAG